MPRSLSQHLVRSAVVVGAFTVVCGVVYPVVVTGVAAVCCARAAGGSAVVDDRGVVVGSGLVGQRFASPRYVQGRPSATTPAYNGMSSSGSNLGPTNPQLLTDVSARVAAVRAHAPESRPPVDLVTASGSGLDPDVSPESALLQAEGVAAARGVDVDAVRAVINANVVAGGVLGPARVNVLAVNRALDARFAR